MDQSAFQAMRTDPGEFRRRLLVDTGAGPRLFGEIERPWQAEDFAALDPAWLRLSGQPAEGGYRRGWFERGRGHSKSSDLALMVLHPLIFAPTLIRGIWAAGDRDQAAIGLQRVQAFVRLNPWLSEVLDVQRSQVVNRRTGSTLTVISSDAATSWGHLVEFVVCDELSTWERSGEDLWHSMLSTAAKKSNAVLVCISNAGWG